MKNTLKNLHQAAQYLAAIGISFIEKKSDDSHTNVGWNKIENRMETHLFNTDCQLALNLTTQNLEWLKNKRVTAALHLNKTAHKEILSWIAKQAKENNLANDYSYSFHYELPYDEMTADDAYVFNSADLKTISAVMTKAQNVFEAFLATNNLESPIRIWPHHFDLGIYASLKAENVSMGAGLAIPDSLVDDFYFYASGYNSAGAIETKSFGAMNFGEFRADWNGATLASSVVENDQVIEFLNEAKAQFLASA